MFPWIRGIDGKDVRLEGDRPMAEELGWPLGLATVVVSSWHIIGDASAGVDDLFLFSSPKWSGQWCDVSCAFTLVRGFARMVVYASIYYVPIATSS